MSQRVCNIKYVYGILQRYGIGSGYFNLNYEPRSRFKSLINKEKNNSRGSQNYPQLVTELRAVATPVLAKPRAAFLNFFRI